MRITIMGEPIPKARARTCIKNGRVMSFTPSKTVDAENAIRAQIAPYKEFFGEGIPLRVDMVFYVTRPLKSAKKRVYPSVRPDIDNYVKLVMDACNRFLWADDGQIVDLRAQKLYGIPPRIEIELQELK